MKGHLEHLFNDSKEFLAALKGCELDPQLEGSPMLLSPSSATPFLKNLHITLSKAYPETGMPYWRVRSWELSCWQPIYLALICVYHIKLVPKELHALHQAQQHDYVAGYALPDGEWFSGEHNLLIQYAAQQLLILFEALESTHITLLGGKKSQYRAILADLLLSSMVNAGQAFASIETIKAEYILWATALNLNTDLSKIKIEGTDSLIFYRRTCCLHYRRNDGEFCNNCPRIHKKHKVREHHV
ncbi:siderophore ferric iron reductase [Marinomonas sp. C2222]|uniref:Siderophore ferric iron reductase n=1 Tax=Marinomonas sargassi TaxID=2984494 RepID=A0ABT2YQ57_9GAMM|nr:siderophore ferric iron reductase [Marinomonas sargassi]MCV2402018.1 siderophore ferric iron reductase [Marinomonas sargassi]